MCGTSEAHLLKQIQKLFNNCGECLDRPPQVPLKNQNLLPPVVEWSLSDAQLSAPAGLPSSEKDQLPQSALSSQKQSASKTVKMIMFIKLSSLGTMGLVLSALPYRVCWVICNINTDSTPPPENSITKFCFTVCLPGNTTKRNNT